MSKPQIAFYWCASCGGCEEAVIDLAETLLQVVEMVDIAFWPCAMDFKREDVEAMGEGQMTACFINGAIRTSEQGEMARLLRRKSSLLVAFGSCSQLGGIPGLANLYANARESILQTVYGDGVFSTVNPKGVRPQAHAEVSEGCLELPSLHESVKMLNQAVPVDYYLPGCPPPVKLILEVVVAIVEGKLPPKGTVLAPDITLCHDCPRIDSKPEKPFILEFKRPHEVLIDPEVCFLAQGLVCMGPATRSGCDHACIKGNMPCTGCMGPASHVRDQGAAALSAIASLVASNDTQEIAAIMDQIPDPAGTFYRYGVPASIFFNKCSDRAEAGTSEHNR